MRRIGLERAVILGLVVNRNDLPVPFFAIDDNEPVDNSGAISLLST